MTVLSESTFISETIEDKPMNELIAHISADTIVHFHADGVSDFSLATTLLLLKLDCPIF